MDNIIEKEDEDARNSESDQKSDDQGDDELEFEEFYDERIKEVLLKQFDETQKERYEIFRRTKIEASNEFNKIKEFAGTVLPGVTVGKSSRLILATTAKICAGELVEEGISFVINVFTLQAKKIMTELGEKGTIEPHHLREAYRRINYNNSDDKFTESEMLYF